MKISTFLAPLVLAITATLFAPTPAHAAAGPNCGPDYGMCVYWGQSYNGSYTNISEEVANYPTTGSTIYTFKTAGTGQGQRIGNNNGSNRNYSIFCNVVIYYNPNFSGPTVTLANWGNPGWQRAGSGLGVLLNNMRSSRSTYCAPD